jgi:hypothetical protein
MLADDHLKNALGSGNGGGPGSGAPGVRQPVSWSGRRIPGGNNASDAPDGFPEDQCLGNAKRVSRRQRIQRTGWRQRTGRRPGRCRRGYSAGTYILAFLGAT